MKVSNIVVPIISLVVAIACGILCVKMFAIGQLGAGFSLLTLTFLSGFFVYHDVRRLFF